MLPLFLPGEVRIDSVMRASIGTVIFTAAYTAENVRGGLQAIPSGQVEAAKALGLNNIHITLLIVLPQALRMVIPAIVGQFISLFKDTTLVLIVGSSICWVWASSVDLARNSWGCRRRCTCFIAVFFWCSAILCPMPASGSRQRWAWESGRVRQHERSDEGRPADHHRPRCAQVVRQLPRAEGRQPGGQARARWW